MDAVETGGLHGDRKTAELGIGLQAARIMDSIASTPLVALGTGCMLMSRSESKLRAVIKLVREPMSKPTQSVER